MADDILIELANLHRQATTERSHYYTGNCVARSIAEITTLRQLLSDAGKRVFSWAENRRREKEMASRMGYMEMESEYAAHESDARQVLERIEKALLASS